MKKVLAIILMSSLAGLWSVKAADAKTNYTKNCAFCHGKDGAGKTMMGRKYKLKDWTDAKVQAKLKDEELVKTIKEGVKKNGALEMKAFADKFNDDEIKALVKYIRAFKK